jgi:outer membrane protein
VNWIRVMGTAAATLTLAVCGNAALAQTRPASGDGAKSGAEPGGHADPAATSGTKIAAINFRAAIANSAEGKQAAAQLDAQFAERRKEIEDLNKKIADLQQKLSASTNVISDEERNKITTEGQKLTRQLDRRQQDFQEDFSDAQNEVIQRIGQRVVQVIGKYAPSNGYVAVLDDSAQTTPVMYAATDITQEIIKLYDQTYPAKASAATSETRPGTNGAKTASSKPTGQ